MTVRFMPHAPKGIDYVRSHPEQRAADLLQALRDPEVDMILCAIGGDDSYRLLPYLFGRGELSGAASDKILPRLFPTPRRNHFMFHKAGMRSFYGQPSSRTSASWPPICRHIPGGISRS